MTSGHLPVAPGSDPAPAGAARGADWLDAARRARRLSWLSLAWVGAEGAIGVAAGILAGSIALIGFGLDSVIEGLASLVIVRPMPSQLVSGRSPVARWRTAS